MAAGTVAIGGAAGGVPAGGEPDAGVLRQMYREMLLARLFDERMIQLNRAGKVPLSVSCQGHEAAQIGAAFAFDLRHDWFLPYYRDWAVCLHAGMTIREFMLNLFSKSADPNSGGRQMASHFGSRRLRIVTQSSPVTTQFLHATGIAYAAKLRREPDVCYASCGEGSTSQGDFHEALNFAAIHRLPVVFFVQNNDIAISVPLAKQMAVQQVADRAAAYGMPGVQVDGGDVLATYEVTRAAVERARRGDGPSLVEARCARFQPHSGDDDDRYRAPEEVAALRRNDPVARFRRELVARDLLDDAADAALTRELRAEIDDATRHAEAAPDADPATLERHVFAQAQS
jgi:2-oxoisovalerate dehydrogenase E1 component alpha subunit